MSGFTDPFAVAPQPPGAGGVSPDIWRSLATLGAGMAVAANARTASGHLAYGTGLAGPLGAGVLGAQQQGQDLAKTRSALAYQGAQTQGTLIENQLKGLGLPVAAARAQTQYRFMTDPAFRSQFLQSFQGAAPGQAADNTAPDVPPDAIPTEQRDPMLAAAVKGTPIPPAALGSLTAVESSWRPGARNAESGAFGLTGVLPSTASNPGYGLAPLPANSTPADQLRFGAQYLYARGKELGLTDADWQSPTKVRQALAAYHGPATDANGVNGQEYAQRVQPGGTGAPFKVVQAGNGPIPVPSGAPNPREAVPVPQGQSQGAPQGTQQPQPPQGQPTGQSPMPAAPQPDPQAMAKANQYEQQASMVELAKGFGLPVPGDPAALRQAAQAWREYAFAGAKAGAAKAAELPFTQMEIRPGGGGYRADLGWVKFPQVEAVQNTDGSTGLSHVSPAMPNEPPGTPGTSTPVLDANGKPIVKTISPQLGEFYKERGAHLATQFDKIDSDAASAKESNYLFDNLRNDSRSWDMGKFADIEGDARAWLSAAAQAAGIETPGLNEKLADYQAFSKSSGMLLRAAVHDTSSRAAVQEYTMIGRTLPQPTTSQQGFGQIADQWQGLSDFRLAKQKFAQRFQGNPQDFNVEFNSKVSPTSFFINRMSQTPQGQHDMQTMLSRLQTTPEGRISAGRILQQYKYAKSAGLFDDLPPTGPAPQ